MQSNQPHSGGRILGIAIVILVVLSLVSVAFHPVTTTQAPAQKMAQIQDFALADELVHGFLIAAAGGLLWCLALFTLRRPPNRGLAIGGLLAYGLGTAGLVGATLIDGFVTPAVAVRFGQQAVPVLQGGQQLLAFSAIGVQVLTRFGVSAMSAGILLWGLDLLHARGPLRISGIIGVASAASTVLLLVIGGSVSAHTVSTILILQALWYGSIAYLLMREAL
jgi:hypothetical protein